MNQNDKANIAYKIDGYIFPSHPMECASTRFGKAKKELREAIERELALLDEITEAQYLHSKKKGFKP